MPGKGTCPLLPKADWFSGSSWYVYITGWEQMGWQLQCVGRGHEHGTFRPHSVKEQIGPKPSVLWVGEKKALSERRVFKMQCRDAGSNVPIDSETRQVQSKSKCH